ncbi:DsbA family protein [Falsiphaeobacter marinintestinus]|uniref:DsbA family protein n=1 Tax=Falsiphaeobacter marinintestinus TaxID=1492905 RepID=UPI0011B622FD|nr:DsbA family protein [Phaeobacter marinintestinus]
MTRLITAIGAVALLALGGFLFMSPRGGDLPVNPLVGAANAQDAADVDISTVQEMVLGDENAPITMIEYASYTCPHCASFHEGTFKQLKTDYIDTGKVKFVYREVYFDRYGLWASMMARCEPAKFFGITDLVFQGQSEWSRAGGPVEIVGELRKIGRLAGISEDKLDACLKDAEAAQTLVAWYQHNVDEDGITSTPSFIIDGKMVENQPYADLKKILDDKLGG